MKNLPSRREIQDYLDRKCAVLMREAKSIYLNASVELSLCRGIVIPFCFPDFNIYKVDYFIYDFFDCMSEFLYSQRQDTIDYNYFYKVSFKYNGFEFMGKKQYSKYNVSGTKINPFHLPKLKNDTYI